MEGFPSIKSAKITPKSAKKIKDTFKNWSMFSVGKTRTHITPSGGIHFSGKLTETTALTFEIKRGGGYIMISLFEYPKGVVFHAHVYYSDLERKSKQEWGKVIEQIYNEVKTIFEEFM